VHFLYLVQRQCSELSRTPLYNLAFYYIHIIIIYMCLFVLLFFLIAAQVAHTVEYIDLRVSQVQCIDVFVDSKIYVAPVINEFCWYRSTMYFLLCDQLTLKSCNMKIVRNFV